MSGYYWNLIPPMLQFLAMQSGYTVYWIVIFAMMQNGYNKVFNVIKGKILTCITLGVVSTINQTNITKPETVLLIHGAWFILCCLIRIRYPQKITIIEPRQYNIFDMAEITPNDKTILTQINELKLSGELRESTLQNLYHKNKNYIDANNEVKHKIHTDVIGWRKKNNIKCRVVDENGQKRFIKVNHRSVEWLE